MHRLVTVTLTKMYHSIPKISMSVIPIMVVAVKYVLIFQVATTVTVILVTILAWQLIAQVRNVH